ncbi:MAG: hypothetical protein GY719_32135 [bacterium]|nr:hypothetical protein [bacterium]
MSPILIAGIVAVVLALVAYSVGFFSIERQRRVSGQAATSLTVGVALDVVATACMFQISTQGPFTPHALIGIVALAAMVMLTILAWRHRGRLGDGPVSQWLHGYARVAYILWVVAFVLGVALGASK